MGIRDIILNFLAISIPEEFAMASIILILLKRFDCFEKENFFKSMIEIFLKFVIPIGIISNVMLLIFKISANINLLISMVTISISILILNLDIIKKSKNKKFAIIKIILFSILGMIIFTLTEIITLIICKYGFHTSIDDIINKTVLLNFVITIPERIIQYGIVSFFIIKSNSLYPKLKMIDVVLKNRLLLCVSSMLLIIDIIIISLTYKYLFIMNVLKTIAISYQLFIIISILSLVLINMLTILLIAICIYPKEKYLQEFRKEGNL
ncbi:hypothetical protein [Clostridium sp.]|uniref:hypothetical protein n=1 Tax=Clostridium sp. TaxID=1506 RepID=UPI0026287FC4|nr:hypothetical protein [Clostridium sp.]